MNDINRRYPPSAKMHAWARRIVERIQKKVDSGADPNAPKKVSKPSQKTLDRKAGWEALQQDAADTMSSWEKTFLADVIRRNKKPSEKQQNIINRIRANMEAAKPDEDGNHWWTGDEVLEAVFETDVSTLGNWEKTFQEDMQRKCNQRKSSDWMSEKQKNMCLSLPTRVANKVESEKRKAAEKVQMESVTTEAGFERIAELMKGAMDHNQGRGLKKPAVTLTVQMSKEHGFETDQVYESGEFRTTKVVYKASQKNPNVVEVSSSHRNYGKTYGLIDITTGDFTYNGLCPDWVVVFTRKVAEDPEAAAVENGFLTGNCCFCHADLTDHRSTAMGYGPVCAKNYGLPWSEVAYQGRLKLRITKMQSVRSIRDDVGKADDAADGLKTTETITCEGCGQYALHPSDYAREAKRDDNIAAWACNNGCNGYTYFDEVDEKCEARFVIKTSDFLSGAHEVITGVKPIDVIREINVIDEPTTVKPRTWDCLCGKQYHSSTGRYNHLKKNLPGCGKAN